MKLLHELLGEHTVEIWLAGVFWSIMGIAFIKVYFYNRKNKFSLKCWLNDNLRDVILGLIASLLILRLGDYVIHFLRDRFNFTIPETTDFVVYMIIISGSIQVYLHKKRKPLSKNVENEMHVHNENCKH